MSSSLFQPVRPVTDDEISGEEKRRRVARLVEDLKKDFIEVNYLPWERNAAMEQLKVFGRNPENADPIFTRDGIEILTHHSFHSTSPTTSKAALQCLANALLARPETRQMFVNLGYSEKAVKRLKNPKKDDEFLMSRILFLTSYNTTQSFITLIEKNHLADYVNDNIERHLKRVSKSKGQPSTQDDASLSETLKLLFNITHFCPTKLKDFAKSISYIMKILSSRTPPSPPLQPPVNYLINALMNLDMEEKKGYKKAELKTCIAKLIDILDLAIGSYDESQLGATVVPLVTLLKRAAKISSSELQTFMKQRLLPLPENGRSKSSHSDTLPDRLIDFMANPVSPQLYDAISGLFFELLDNNADNLIREFGFGISSGFMMTRNMQTKSANRSSTSSKSSQDTQKSSYFARPVSGAEKALPVIPRAEKVMLLFDKLQVSEIKANDPRMRAATKSLVVELDSEDDS
ncbi:hypothetical protein M501DRAFT_1014899 [Patellaria atrata CBS 101060]|uniref:Synembryn-A n=1 Tax=Patellaria atrata CBS 101060 TaxID=1346257 RepID=A0A9P4SFL6_9PEZI|nr:hypothetical protein M501DRAFT_1014899 [Patellaria atrata CBS 101060]